MFTFMLAHYTGVPLVQVRNVPLVQVRNENKSEIIQSKLSEVVLESKYNADETVYKRPFLCPLTTGVTVLEMIEVPLIKVEELIPLPAKLTTALSLKGEQITIKYDLHLK